MQIEVERKGKRIDFLTREYAMVPAIEFVKAVNSVYYRYSAEEYDATPDIIHDAVAAWDRVLGQIRSKVTDNDGYMVVDIGAGTGFVADRLLQGRLPVSGYIGYEPAEAMREIARQKIRHPAFTFLELDIGTKLSAQIGQIPGRKIVTLNSVLHHIVWWEEFLADIVAALNRDDLLVICHEPNSRFWENPRLVANFDAVAAERRVGSLAKYLNPLRYYRRFRRLLRWEKPSSFQLISQQLQNNGVITKPLPPAVISAITDYSVPLCWRDIPVNAGYDEGFYSIDRLQREHLRDFDLVEAFTYQHLAISPVLLSAKWLRIEKELARQFTDEGAQFCLIAARR